MGIWSSTVVRSGEEEEEEVENTGEGSTEVARQWNIRVSTEY